MEAISPPCVHGQQQQAAHGREIPAHRRRPNLLNPAIGKEKEYVPENDSDDESEDGDDDDEEDELEEDEDLVGHEATHTPNVDYDKEDPPMIEGSTYPTMKEFKIALCMYAIKGEFEFNTAKSGKHRFRAYCSRKHVDKCSWRIYASSTVDRSSVVVRKNPCDHTCFSTRRKKKVKNATKHWVCEKVKDFLIDDATLKAKALKAQIESCSPSSSVIIDHHTINGKIRFRRLFFALKPCIEGFLSGCRPYLAIDSTFLTGRFKGQLASASAVDGHNWLYPVAFGVFDSETNDNWIWFMERLREAIGSPRGLAICTDAGQPVMEGVGKVFPEAEHRECMFHLVNNFKKKYNGKVFDDHLWAAAYSWNPYLFEKYWATMDQAKPEATNYLKRCHTRLWTRSQFRTICKVDYVTNNLVQCLNNWIKHHKSLNLDDLMDKIRQLLMMKWNQRRKVASKLEGLILPHIIKKLHEQSHELNLEVVECASEHVAEVTAMGGSGFRFVVNLHERTCSCRKWQVCGLPCKHALAYITSLPNARIENYVDMCYSIDKFRAAYAELIPAMPDKSQWSKSTHGFFYASTFKQQLVGLKLRDSKDVLRKIRNANISVPFVKTMAIIGIIIFNPPIPMRKSRSGSNQSEPISIEFQSSNEQRPTPKKGKRKTKKKEMAKNKPDIPMPLFDDSPAIGTRNKRIDSSTPAMSTRSKRRC
ncbi:LOW QUALITY PROTEIN: hypothetical protein U9M48_036792 [Paspalum notatum var. saurae]|uniref:SWIM-type domain-containing protein n=1 Tax=Paspalum notatum var. saurae TaxID=547442 RepID=A0AAQ3UDS3_PASNO